MPALPSLIFVVIIILSNVFYALPSRARHWTVDSRLFIRYWRLQSVLRCSKLFTVPENTDVCGTFSLLPMKHEEAPRSLWLETAVILVLDAYYLYW